MKTNEIESKVETTLTTFNALPILDKKFVRGIVTEKKDRIKYVMNLYNLNSESDADIKLMTLLGRNDIKQAMSEISSIQIAMFESSVLYKSEAAVNKMFDLMENSIDDEVQLKAATQVSKLGMEIVKEKSRKNENKTMKVIIENPSADVNINIGGFSKEQVGNSFIPQEETVVIDAEIVPEEEEKPKSSAPTLVDENGNTLSF